MYIHNVYILTFNDSLSIDSFSAGLSKAVARVISSCALEEVASSYIQSDSKNCNCENEIKLSQNLTNR